jgi:hypothetical protein
LVYGVTLASIDANRRRDRPPNHPKRPTERMTALLKKAIRLEPFIIHDE